MNKHSMKKAICLSMILMVSCLFTSQLSAQKSKIKPGELPEEIQMQLDKKYSKYVTNSIFRIQDDKNPVRYEVELQKKNNILLLEFDEKGILMYSEKSHSYTFDGTEPVKKKSTGSDGHNNHSH